MGPLYSEYFYKRAVATIANINVPSTIRELSIQQRQQQQHINLRESKKQFMIRKQCCNISNSPSSQHWFFIKKESLKNLLILCTVVKTLLSVE